MVVIFAPAARGDGHIAGARGRAVDQHGAGAALAFAAAVLGAGEIEAIAQDREKIFFLGSGDLETRAVDVQNVVRHGKLRTNGHEQDSAIDAQRTWVGSRSAVMFMSGFSFHALSGKLIAALPLLCVLTQPDGPPVWRLRAGGGEVYSPQTYL